MAPLTVSTTMTGSPPGFAWRAMSGVIARIPAMPAAVVRVQSVGARRLPKCGLCPRVCTGPPPPPHSRAPPGGGTRPRLSTPHPPHANSRAPRGEDTGRTQRIDGPADVLPPRHEKEIHVGPP